MRMMECQCPLGLIPHFYRVMKLELIMTTVRCQCPLGLIPHFYRRKKMDDETMRKCVNALSGLYLISTEKAGEYDEQLRQCVNALSGLYLISTPYFAYIDPCTGECQCPLGLIPHFYAWRLVSINLSKKSACQCPLGLIPHFYVPLQKPRFYAVYRACFCRYLSEYSDNSRFSCMLTFWTYLMRCTYP